MRHEFRLTVRSYECDSNGHVNNATYLNYFEAARVDFLRAIGTSYRRLRERGFGLVIVRAAVDFKEEARMEDRLLIVTESVKRRLTGGTFSQRVYREDGGTLTLLADGELVWACVDERKRPVRLPPELDVPALVPEIDPTAGPTP